MRARIPFPGAPRKIPNGNLGLGIWNSGSNYSFAALRFSGPSNRKILGILADPWGSWCHGTVHSGDKAEINRVNPRGNRSEKSDM
jgi:hypothetical protein